MSGSESSSSSSSVDSDIEECFLRSCRNGDISMVNELLERKAEGTCIIDVSCKGKSKSNLGWTPLVSKIKFNRLLSQKHESVNLYCSGP